MQTHYDIVHNLPKKCRTCLTQVETTQGFYWIPSDDQWFRLIDYKCEHRNIDPTKVLCYCQSCYIQYTLDKHCEFRCCNCGMYDNYKGFPPNIKQNHPLISSNAALGEFIFVSDKPDHLKQDGYLCIPCLSQLQQTGIIKKCRKYDEPCCLCHKVHEDGNVHLVLSSTVILSFDNECVVEPPINVNKFPAHICGICLKQFKVTNNTFIQCDLCHNKFKQMYHNQASKCCSSVNERSITCGYGSEYDTSTYSWSHGVMPEKYKDVRQLCDNCITTLIEDNVIKFKEHYM